MDPYPQENAHLGTEQGDWCILLLGDGSAKKRHIPIKDAVV